MDALKEHLESLASLGTVESRGVFTVAGDQVWERLRQALPDGNGSLRFLLRWMHARGAHEIAIRETRPHSLTVTAEFAEAALAGVCDEEGLDLAGRDIDFARATAASQLLGLPLNWEVKAGEARYTRDFANQDAWQREFVDAGNARIQGSYSFTRQQWSLVAAWEKSVKRGFRASPLPLSWNGASLSSAYNFDVPVLVWRHLRPQELRTSPLLVTAPRTAIESFRAARPIRTDVVLGMMMGFPSGDQPEIELLRHGELLPLPVAGRELAGFAGMIRDDEHPLDIQGSHAAWNAELQALVTSFADEAVDMALQLFRRETPLTSREAESIFLAMQSVLLHLLTQQRFTEGHLLAEWLRAQMGRDSGVMKGFRAGYTFDRICAYLAEPAGQPQTALRWSKAADARVREASARQPEVADEALQISARLELRARRNQARQLSGDTQARLCQLAFRQERKRRFEEAADIHLMVARALPPSGPERIEALQNAARCGELAGNPYYGQVAARERVSGQA